MQKAPVPKKGRGFLHLEVEAPSAELARLTLVLP